MDRCELQQCSLLALGFWLDFANRKHMQECGQGESLQLFFLSSILSLCKLRASALQSCQVLVTTLYPGPLSPKQSVVASPEGIAISLLGPNPVAPLYSLFIKLSSLVWMYQLPSAKTLCRS